MLLYEIEFHYYVIIFFFLILFMQPAYSSSGGGANNSNFNFNASNPERKELIIIVCITFVITIAVILGFTRNHNLHPVGLDARTLEPFLHQYQSFEDIYTFLCDSTISKQNKNIKLASFDAFLEQCKSLPPHETRFAIRYLNEMLKTDYSEFNEFLQRAKLLIR